MLVIGEAYIQALYTIPLVFSKALIRNSKSSRLLLLRLVRSSGGWVMQGRGGREKPSTSRIVGPYQEAPQSPHEHKDPTNPNAWNPMVYWALETTCRSLCLCGLLGPKPTTDMGF